jgi:hypothetical protein
MANVLFNLSDKIIGGNVAGDYLTWRKRVLADGGTLLDDAFVNETISKLQADKLFDKFSTLYTPNARKAGKMYSLISSAGDATVTRASVKNVLNQSGVLEQIANDVTPSSFKGDRFGALVEPSATNQIRNNTMVGAVVGTPGTLPTNWGVINLRGLSTNIVGFGISGGIEYIDIRYSGTANANDVAQIRFETTTQISASNGQTWTQSAFLNGISGNVPQIGFQITYRDSGGAQIGTPNTLFDITGTQARYEFTNTINNASTAFVQPYITARVFNGVAYDFTIRIGLPQMELGSVATSPIKTTTASVTRSADNISKTGASDLIGQSEGWFYALVNVENMASGTERMLFSIDVGNVNDGFRLSITGGGSLQYRVLSGGTGTNVIFQTINNYPTGLVGFYVRYKSGDYAIYANGEVATSTSSAYPVGSLSRITLGMRGDGGNRFNDHIFLAGTGTTELTEAQAIALSQAHL